VSKWTYITVLSFLTDVVYFAKVKTDLLTYRTAITQAQVTVILCNNKIATIA